MLKAWTTSDTAYELFYKDDVARGFLGAITTAGLLQTQRWHTTIVTIALGALRVTDQMGYGIESGGFGTIVSNGGQCLEKTIDKRKRRNVYIYMP